ncbi:MAG: glycosyltransferase family 2 protein [Candidatus Omnitrophota bacterium]|nr:glycosyltransferase family 2 protein [Candidatus Omnitrophota bacterium]
MKKQLKDYYYSTLFRYYSVYVRPNNTVVEVNPVSDMAIRFFKNVRFLFIGKDAPASLSREHICSIDQARNSPPDYFLLNNIQYEGDIQKLFSELHAACSPSTRILITYYSSMWKPLIWLATMLKLREKTFEQNWIAHEDMANFLLLTDYEPVLVNTRIICPMGIPLVSDLLNRYFAVLPFFRLFCIANILMARPLLKRHSSSLSVSVIVPARNEADNIESAVKRIPHMGPDDEIIFVEGHSKDGTWDRIIEAQKKYSAERKIAAIKQSGIGKADAVRKGLEAASKDVLMILDADLSVAPESLRLFYDAIVKDKGEFVNGSRLVYPMDKKAMRFLNIVGNKFFATAFSYVLGQRFKDTLCGTKVLLKENYRKIAETRSFFGEFDPFGDFDLIFGASRLGLKIVEIPIVYKERSYGTTNIHRWRHGFLLLKMLLYSARKIKFV